MSTMSSNVWYAIAERMGRNKASFTFGIYGKVCAGKQSFARALAGRMDAEGWHRVFLPIDLYLKANRENRTVMLKKGFSDYGFTEEYDKIQLEAYAIDEKALAEDINGIKERKNVTRSGLYDVNTGKHTGILSVASSRWNSTAAIIDGTLAAAQRKKFDLLIRVEAPYEVRKKRYQEKVAKAMYPIPEWHFDGMERIAEKSIFENWDISDIVVRGEDGTFQLE